MTEKDAKSIINDYIEMVIDDLEAIKNEKDPVYVGKRLGLISALKSLKTCLTIYDPDLSEDILEYDLDKRYL